MRAFICMILIILLATSCTKVAPQGKEPQQKPPTAAPQNQLATVSDYFPLKENSIYTYKGEGNEYASKVVTLEYLKGRIAQLNTNNGGTSLAEVVIVGQGAVKKVFKKEESYWRENFIDQRQDEEVILQQPLKVGNEWESNGKKYRITSLDTKVVVPFGTHQAIKVVTELQDATFIRYFAKDIGIIKEEFISGSAVVSSLLTEVLNEPSKMNIELFYPNSNADALVASKQELLFHTNESIAQKVLEALQHPTVEGVSPAIANNVKLISYERKDTTLRLNFSKELISNANVGTAGEQLLLDSIVESFGKAYSVQSVIINIENEAYESGHFSFGKDEALQVKSQTE